MRQHIPNRRLLARPLIHHLPIPRQQILHLRMPIEDLQPIRERRDVLALREVVYEDAEGCGGEGF